MEIVDENDPRLRFVAIEKATTPPGGLIEHLKDQWWVVHPEKGLTFYSKHRSPQCNSNEACTRTLAAMYPWADIRFIPSVFRRIDPQDYVF